MSRISNDRVIEIANTILYGEEQENHKYLIASNQIANRAVTFLGHIIRDENSFHAHVKNVTVNSDLTKYRRDYRRVGRPRIPWLETTMKKTFKWHNRKAHCGREKFDINNPRHRNTIRTAALDRKFPFHKKKYQPKIRKKKTRIRRHMTAKEGGKQTHNRKKRRTRPEAGEKRKHKEMKATTCRRSKAKKTSTHHIIRKETED